MGFPLKEMFADSFVMMGLRWKAEVGGCVNYEMVLQGGLDVMVTRHVLEV